MALPAHDLRHPWDLGVALAIWFENLEEEGGFFFSAVAATIGAVMFAVAAVGVIAQGVRLGRVG